MLIGTLLVFPFITLGSYLSWNDYIISIAKAAACKLGFLFRIFYTFTQLLILPYIQGSNSPLSRIWLISLERSLQVLSCSIDAIQWRAITLIEDSTYRRTVSTLYFSHRYQGVCSDEIKSIVPPKTSFAWNTIFSNI